MIPYYNASIFEAIALLNGALPAWLVASAEDLATLLIPLFGDYGLEIQANAEKIGMPVGAAVLLNIFYEIEAACTSIVAQDSKGNIYHARNLDFGLAPVLRRLVINVEFQSGGKTQYLGASYAGYVGLLTGMRPGAFSITLNQRDEGYLWENIIDALFVPGTRVSAFLIRDTLQNIGNFSAAVNVLVNTPLVAPSYLTIGGTKQNEGVVITRDRLDAANIWQLNSQQQSWWVIETNTDHWDSDYWCEGCRSTVARKVLEGIGQEKVGLDGLMEVLSTQPVMNPSTTYTSLMWVAKGNLTTFAREL